MSIEQYTTSQLAAAARIAVGPRIDPETGQNRPDHLILMVTTDTIRYGRIRQVAEMVLGHALPEDVTPEIIRRRLLLWAAADLRGEHRFGQLEEPTDLQYAIFGRRVAALLGSHERWPGSEMLGWVEEAAANLIDFPAIGGQSPAELVLWRTVADQLGIEHDGEEDDDLRECDRCGDKVQTLSSQDFCDSCEEADAANEREAQDDINREPFTGPN